jgi:hypothetical protein
MSKPKAVIELIRRAILDLLNEIGGEHNDDVLMRWLAELGHRIPRRDVRAELAWLAGQDLVATEEVGPYVVARIRPDGIDVAEGRLTIEGVRRHKTGE